MGEVRLPPSISSRWPATSKLQSAGLTAGAIACMAIEFYLGKQLAMNPRNALTLQTQLFLPMIPFVVDTFARGLLLRHQLEWYQIPDLVTFLVTYAFFCLGVMFTVNSPMIRTDQDVIIQVELVRQRLLGTCLFFITFAGVLSVLRAFDEFASD
jgi:hypothetical protein